MTHDSYPQAHFSVPDHAIVPGALQANFIFSRKRCFAPPVLSVRMFQPKLLLSFLLVAGTLTGALATPLSLTAQQSADEGARSLEDAPAAWLSSAQRPQSPAQGTPAQTSSGSTPASKNQSAQAASAGSAPPQTKRILGIVPNFRAVSADVKLPPETVKEKFMDATQDSFDYSSIFLPVALAAYSMGTDATPEFHQGAAGYARYFWHAAVDQTSENYMVEFIFPTVTREDSRYYTLGHGGFLKRTGYALSRAVITRSNSGSEVFNVSEVVGAGAASGLSSLYYPTRERSFANTGTEWGLDIGIDAASFWVREFWPEINRAVFHNKYSEPPAQP